VPRGGREVRAHYGEKGKKERKERRRRKTLKTSALQMARKAEIEKEECL